MDCGAILSISYLSFGGFPSLSRFLARQALQLGAFSYLCTKLFSEGAVNSPYRELYS